MAIYLNGNKISGKSNENLQYAPFSINNGMIDPSGNNITLQTTGDVPISVDNYVIPQLSSNTSEYGTCNDYNFTSNSNGTNLSQFTMDFSENNHIHAGGIATFTLTAMIHAYNYKTGYYYYYGLSGCKITYIYTDDTTGVMYDNRAVSGWIESTSAQIKTITEVLPAAAKEVKGIVVDTYADRFTHRHGGLFTLKAQYTVSSADTLICNPCTITTADSKTKSFTTNTFIDCSTKSNGTYKVMKSYISGNLFLIQNFNVSKIAPTLINWTMPKLSANGTLDGTDFAVSMTNESTSYQAYKAVDNNTSTYAESTSSEFDFILYNPQSLNIKSINISWYSTTYYSTMHNIYGSNDNLTWELLVEKNNSQVTETIDLNINTKYYKYYKIESIQGTETVRIKNITIIGSLIASNYWLDISDFPLTLKQYNGGDWQTNNELVYLGDIKISSNVIASITNNGFNKYSYLLNPYPITIETYNSGTSWYRIDSDGWCEQGGLSYAPQSISLLKPYKNTNYGVITSSGIKSISTVGGIDNKTTSGFDLYLKSGSGTQYIMYWLAYGYIN